MQEDENEVIEELDKLLMADLEPSIAANLPTVPSDNIEEANIEDQLPDVPTKVTFNTSSFSHIVSM